MRLKTIRRRDRFGMAIPEWFAVVGGLMLVIVLAIGTLGRFGRQGLEDTAGGVADPAALRERFSRNNPAASNAAPGRSSESAAPASGRSRSRGNNGVGNGEDPQPPGNAPVNDGPGTSPGNPGMKGGKKK